MPGLLALGAHTLNLTLAGIDRAALSPDARRSYDLLKHYDLNSLHMAAAKGLAMSCYLMYADQPTGLGAETVMMKRPEGEISHLWIDVMQKWRASGGRGYAPGLGDKPPVPFTGDISKSDYSLSAAAYFLRPEVRGGIVGIPALAFLSARSLFVLYSILFCSKLGSFRYSSRAPASETGAWKTISNDT